MRALNTLIILLTMGLSSNLLAMGQENGNETQDPITKKPTGISMDYCEQELPFEDFIQVYIGDEYSNFMNHIRYISSRFYYARLNTAKETVVCVTNLDIEQVIIDLPKNNKKRIAGWKSNFMSGKHRLAIKKDYIENKTIPAIEKSAVLLKELLHYDFNDSKDPYWAIKKNEAVKTIFESYTTGVPSIAESLQILKEREMIGEPLLFWVLNGCEDSPEYCDSLKNEFLSYYDHSNSLMYRIVTLLSYGERDLFTMYSSSHCQKSANSCLAAYKLVHDFTSTLPEENKQRVYKTAHRYSGYLITLALTSESPEEKQKYYSIYKKLVDLANASVKSFSINDDYYAETESPVDKIKYRKRKDYQVDTASDFMHISTGKVFKSAASIIDELIQYSVIDPELLEEVSIVSKRFDKLSLHEKKQKFLTQKIWIKTADRFARDSEKKFPTNSKEIKQKKNFEHVLFVAFLVENDLLTENTLIYLSHNTLHVLRKYKETQRAYEILKKRN